jgi:hypothetical protein
MAKLRSSCRCDASTERPNPAFTLCAASITSAVAATVATQRATAVVTRAKTATNVALDRGEDDVTFLTVLAEKADTFS